MAAGMGSPRVLKATWSEELRDDYIATIYVYYNSGRNCGCQCEIKPGHETANSKTSSCIQLQISQIGSSFVGLTWLLTGISERKILFLARNMWIYVIFWMCSHNQQLLALSITSMDAFPQLVSSINSILHSITKMHQLAYALVLYLMLLYQHSYSQSYYALFKQQP